MKDNLSCFQGVSKTLEWMPIIGLKTLKDLIELELKKRYIDWEDTVPDPARQNMKGNNVVIGNFGVNKA